MTKGEVLRIHAITLAGLWGESVDPHFHKQAAPVMSKL